MMYMGTVISKDLKTNVSKGAVMVFPKNPVLLLSVIRQVS